MVKVTLRKKKISGGRVSLYLDFYPAVPDPKGTGKLTRREFLGIYLHEKPADYFEKEENKQREEIAKQVKINRENDLNKLEVYSDFEIERLEIKKLGEKDFIDYFNKTRSIHTDNATLIHLKDFAPKGLKFSDLTEKLCIHFRSYLADPKRSLTPNSAKIYFDRFKASLRRSYKEGYMQTDLSTKVQALKFEDTERQYLTLEELQKLGKAECKSDTLKRMAFLSALTGLRWSDIVKLEWNEVHTSEGYSIHFTQKKTKKVEVLPISEQAFSFLGSVQSGNTRVFDPISYSTSKGHLKKWINAAGIKKDISFHCFRHTYATLQLEAGTDIYTVSKMLGHRNLTTTQVYAKIVDKSKREAAERIKLQF